MASGAACGGVNCDCCPGATPLAGADGAIGAVAPGLCTVSVSGGTEMTFGSGAGGANGAAADGGGGSLCACGGSAGAADGSVSFCAGASV